MPKPNEYPFGDNPAVQAVLAADLMNEPGTIEQHRQRSGRRHLEGGHLQLLGWHRLTVNCGPDHQYTVWLPPTSTSVEIETNPDTAPLHVTKL